MKFNLRSKKIELQPAEIQPGKHYLFIIEDVADAQEFKSVRDALAEALVALDVKGVVVTKPMTAATVEMLADLEHQKWIAWTHSVVDVWADKLPEYLVEQWKAKWIAYADLSQADKEINRQWARRLVEGDW